MKRLPLFVLFVCRCIASFQPPAKLQPQPPKSPLLRLPPVPSKVAVIAFQAAVTQTNEFQRDFADLQKKYDPRRAADQELSATKSTP